MEKFQFFFDQKVTTWNRTHFEVEADSYKEAKKKAIDIVTSGEVCEYSWETIFETTKLMSKEENRGKPTEELYSSKDHQTIYQN